MPRPRETFQPLPRTREAMPRGAVTFLFTDIEGSTERWEHHPRAMERALERHDALVSQAVATHGGVVFKTVGDSVCAAFESPIGALRAALDAQRAVARQDWAAFGKDFPAIRVRMGIHTGPATLRDDDYFGATLNRVARLEAAGHGGQILLSLASQQLLRDGLPEGVTLRDLGQHRLRDLRHSERIYQVLAANLDDVRTSLRTAGIQPASERILVDEAAAARSLPESQRLLLETVRDEERTLTLRPDQLREVARSRPRDLTEYRLGRIAGWCLPHHRLDGRFVSLELLVDQGEETSHGRWKSMERRYRSVADLLEAVPNRAFVLLGPPGSGKSTLLRRLELDLASSVLRGDRPDDVVSIYLELNHYRPERPGGALPLPGDWLAERWARRYPQLPPFQQLADEGRLVLLLDGLNEVPVADEDAFFAVVEQWKAFLFELLDRGPRNRVLFSCRSLDYSAPLSAPELRVPQIRIEPLDDTGVRKFLKVHSPLHEQEVWQSLRGTPTLELLRSPYFLMLVVSLVDELGEIPRGRVSLFTGFVRRALRREIERGNPLFRPGTLLSSRDHRRITSWRWRHDWDLPDHGNLVSRLSRLAYEMQTADDAGRSGHLRLDYDLALEILGEDEDCLRAGIAMSVLDEDPLHDHILFIHQLIQEYFAARTLAALPEAVAQLAQAPWRASEVRPSLAETVRRLAAADPLPPLASTGWEESVPFAAVMAADQSTFVRNLMSFNLALAGRCALQPEVSLDSSLRAELAGELVARGRDAEADLRARIQAARVVGELGDPRYSQEGEALVPPMVTLPAGHRVMGVEDGAEDERPRHEVWLPAFALGCFPVTNAEYARFLKAGGYEDLRWWDTKSARRWREGQGTADGLRNGLRLWRDLYREDPDLLRRRREQGMLDERGFDRWRRRLALDDDAFEKELRTLHPGGREKEPRFWRDRALNHPAHPVVGVSWFEARAYCAWLAATTGRAFRLPSEAEWEVAARGREERRFSFGDEVHAGWVNTVEAHLRSTSPVGVFPEGDTPEGLMDMTGNVFEWTSSLFGRGQLQCDHPYPYIPDDGREDATAGSEITRVCRGGSWYYGFEHCRATTRATWYPDGRGAILGFRLALDPVR